MYGLPPSVTSGVIGMMIGMILMQSPMVIGQIVSAWNQRHSAKEQAETARRVASGTIETSTAAELWANATAARTFLDTKWREALARAETLEARVQELERLLMQLERECPQRKAQ